MRTIEHVNEQRTNEPNQHTAAARDRRDRKRTHTMRRWIGGYTAWISLILACTTLLSANGGMIESERLEEYEARNHTWPPTDDMFTPKTAGWRDLMKKRIRQLERFDDPDGRDKWNGFIIGVYQGLLSPNFTESGWGLTRAPQHIVDELRRSLHSGLVSDPQLEEDMEDEDDMGSPLFIHQDALNERVLNELQPIHEAWSGQKLIGSNAYGLRVYKEGAMLDMHVDKSATHIISSILHVDHDPMGDPWPIVIEDLNGETHEVALESGDMLLYESSKCMHGRPRPFNGAWYTSVFVHYYPVWWDMKKVEEDIAYRIPPGWEKTKVPGDDLDDLVVRGTALREPGCEHNWCALKDSVKWKGPGVYGKVISAGGTTTLDIPMDQTGNDEL